MFSSQEVLKYSVDLKFYDYPIMAPEITARIPHAQETFHCLAYDNFRTPQHFKELKI